MVLTINSIVSVSSPTEDCYASTNSELFVRVAWLVPQSDGSNEILCQAFPTPRSPEALCRITLDATLSMWLAKCVRVRVLQLGCIVYEMCTKKPPFLGQTLDELIFNMQTSNKSCMLDPV
eukprot:1191781-Prorocentrum_minimum.AAC.1